MSTVEEQNKIICEVLDELKELLINKNTDYQGSAFEPVRILSSTDTLEQIRVRCDDKLSRLMNKKQKTIKEDTLNDLIGYLVILKAAQRAQENTHHNTINKGTSGMLGLKRLYLYKARLGILEDIFGKVIVYEEEE